MNIIWITLLKDLFNKHFQEQEAELLWEFRVYYFYELQLCFIPLLKKGEKKAG